MMGYKNSRAKIASMFATILVICLASAAWACSVQPITALGANSGPAGTQLQIQGFGFKSPVQIHWNAVNGSVLASTGAGQFATAIKIPEDASPGVFYVVATDADNERVTHTFEVTAVDAPSSSRSLAWESFNQSPEVTGPSHLGLIAGAALFATGLAGLFAGAAVVAVRRRRVQAKVHS